jgi:hypothetical protein
MGAEVLRSLSEEWIELVGVVDDLLYLRKKEG